MRLAKEFRDFIMRGNVVDLAVGIVIGVAFGNVVSAFVKDLITPILTIPGKTQFQNLTFKIGHAVFPTAISSMSSDLYRHRRGDLLSRRQADERTGPAQKRGEVPPDPTERECPYCLSQIPIKATRCAYLHR